MEPCGFDCVNCGGLVKARNVVKTFALISLLVFSFSLQCQQNSSGTAAVNSSGQVVVSTYDSSGKLISTVDETGRFSRPGAPSVASVPAPTTTVKSKGNPQPLTAATIHVPSDQPTIQAAINAANDGDTVLVSDGTYTENINFNGKAILLTSVNGPATTIIDGGAVDSVVTFRTNEGSGSVINGFTITNGFSNFGKTNFGDGGGVFIANASPVVRNNVITKNQACEGLGIFVNGGAPLIQGNTISSNSAAGCSGGIGGGGIAVLAQSAPQIIGNVITNNNMTVSGLNGGGLSLFAAGSPVIQNNIISNNVQFGIAMVNGSTPHIVQNLIVNNLGGGLTTSAGGTGAVYLNNTFADNVGQSSFISDFGLASAIGGSFPSDAVIQNNLAIAVAGQPAIYCSAPLPSAFVANDVFSIGGGSAYDPTCTSQTGIQGNISSDPLFVDNAVANYHLQPGSPAIDTGNNTVSIGLPATDLDGNPRVVNTTVDMGAFEFQSTTTTRYNTMSLTFASQLVGTTSPAQSITITNTGATALQITAFNPGGLVDFLENDNCHTGSGILAGQTCTINVSFAPSTRGLRSGTLTVISNDAASPTTLSFSGTGIAPVPGVLPTSLTFSSQLVGTTSAAQTATLSNTGDAPLPIFTILATGDFAASNNCGSSLAAGSNCMISVTFTPTLRGTRTGMVNITSTGGQPPVATVGLQGNGIGPAASLSGGLTFTGQLVGTTSASQTISLSSVGETALAISTISASGDFGETNNCPASLPNGQSCGIQVTFTPTARGTRSGNVTVTDNSTTSPEQASLSGTGTAPVVSLSRTSLAFGNQVLDVPVTSTVTLSNVGDAALSVSSITAGGDFTATNNCGTSVASQGHCTVTVAFQPTALGARLGTLTLMDSGLDSPQTVALSGTGVQIGFLPTTLTFGTQVVGTTSATQAVTVTNLAASPLSLTGINASSGFTESNNCGTSLAASASCTITVAFAPAASGPINGLVTVSYGGTQSTVTLTGNAVDFTLGAQSGGSTTATVSAGSTATYNLSVAGTSGFNGSVSLACSGAPQASTCTVNPTSVNLNGTMPASFTVSVATTSRASLAPALRRPPGQWLFWMCVWTITAIVAMYTFKSKRLRWATVVTGLTLLLLTAGCGGGGSSMPPAPTGTPAGTSTITVTATSGSTSRTLNLTLTVN